MSGVWRLRRDPHFLLAPAEGGLSLQRVSAGQQAGLSVAAASEGDPLPSRTSVCWFRGVGSQWKKCGGISSFIFQPLSQIPIQMCHEVNVILSGHIRTTGS